MREKNAERLNLALRLRAVRERAHLKIVDAATAANVQPLAVEKWERGVALPSLIEFRDLLELYGVMPCEVLYESNPLELSPEQSAELAQAAKRFSPGLRARVDCILAVVSRGREPAWVTTGDPPRR